MTGRELLRLQATLHRLPAAEGRRRTQALLARVGLSDAADRRIGTYSGGMRRRLDLATALVHEPRVLFLDEPTTGLDPTSRRAIWHEVRALNAEGTTVFLTTQYLEEADQLAHRVGIIEGGRMAVEGTPRELKSQLGPPRLELRLGGERPERAPELLARFGGVRPGDENGTVVLAIARGAGDVAAVVRTLDEAGIVVESLDLVEPSLDEVFLARTGRGLEGAGAAPQHEAA
jgi:ABC-2 type transport system ATP-binding protein